MAKAGMLRVANQYMWAYAALVLAEKKALESGLSEQDLAEARALIDKARES